MSFPFCLKSYFVNFFLCRQFQWELWLLSPLITKSDVIIPSKNQLPPKTSIFSAYVFPVLCLVNFLSDFYRQAFQPKSPLFYYNILSQLETISCWRDGGIFLKFVKGLNWNKGFPYTLIAYSILEILSECKNKSQTSSFVVLLKPGVIKNYIQY